MTICLSLNFSRSRDRVVFFVSSVLFCSEQVHRFTDTSTAAGESPGGDQVIPRSSKVSLELSAPVVRFHPPA